MQILTIDGIHQLDVHHVDKIFSISNVVSVGFFANLKN